MFEKALASELIELLPFLSFLMRRDADLVYSGWVLIR